MRLVGQHELERRDDVRGDPEQHLALGERLGDEAELELLEIAQAPVDQLGARRRGGAAEVALLDQHDLEAAAGRVAGDADAVDPAADDGEVEDFSQALAFVRSSRRSDECVVVIDAEAEADPPSAAVGEDAVRSEPALDVLGAVQIERQEVAARKALGRRERVGRKQPRDSRPRARRGTSAPAPRRARGFPAA